MNYGFLNPDDMPPEVRAWFEQLAAEAMATFGGRHGMGVPTDGFMVDAINFSIVGEDYELTDEQVEADHNHVTTLHEYVLDRIPEPEDWVSLSMADKVRVVVTDAYMRMTAAGPGTCVHRDRVQRDLLDIADHLDLTSDFGTKGPDTRVSPADAVCVEWKGRSMNAHWLTSGLHMCLRKPGHPGRHRCDCGATKVQ